MFQRVLQTNSTEQPRLVSYEDSYRPAERTTDVRRKHRRAVVFTSHSVDRIYVCLRRMGNFTKSLIRLKYLFAKQTLFHEKRSLCSYLERFDTQNIIKKKIFKNTLLSILIFLLQILII